MYSFPRSLSSVIKAGEVVMIKEDNDEADKDDYDDNEYDDDNDDVRNGD